MFVAEFLGDFLMSFYNPASFRKEWYECQMFKGNKMEFSNILWGGEDSIMFICLDGECAKVPTNICKLL